MFAIVEKNVSMDILYGPCEDAYGDEDNCCEYGIGAFPNFRTTSLFEMI